MNTGECASEWTSARGNSELKLTCTFGRLCLQLVDERIEIRCRIGEELKRTHEASE